MTPEKASHIRLLESQPRNSVDCTACGEPVPPKAIFCPNCGPPVLPEERPEVELTGGQTAARIFVLVLLFSALVVYEMDVDLAGYFKGSSTPPTQNPAQTLSQDEDFEVRHFINVDWANLRDRGSMESKIVQAIKKGSEVKVLETVNNWSKIKYKDKTGWVYSSLLTARVK